MNEFLSASTKSDDKPDDFPEDLDTIGDKRVKMQVAGIMNQGVLAESRPQGLLTSIRSRVNKILKFTKETKTPYSNIEMVDQKQKVKFLKNVKSLVKRGVGVVKVKDQYGSKSKFTFYAEANDKSIFVNYDARWPLELFLKSLGLNISREALQGRNSLKIEIDGVEIQFIYTSLSGYETLRESSEAQLRSLVETDPSKALFLSKAYCDKPYAKEIIKAAVYAIAEKDYPEAVFVYINLFRDEPYAEEIFEKSLEKCHAGAILQNASKFKDRPYAEKILREAAKLMPKEALEYSDLFVDKPYAKEVIEDAVDKQLGYALQFSDKFKDQPWGLEIIEKAARKAGTVLRDGSLFAVAKFKDQPWAKEVLMMEAERAPFRIFQYLKEFADQPYADEIVDKAAEVAVEKSPESILYNFDAIKDKPYASEFLKKAALSCAEDRPWVIFQSIELIKGQLFAEEVLSLLAEKKPGDFLASVEKCVDLSYAEKLIRLAAEKDPRTAVSVSAKFLAKPYGREVLEKAVTKAIETEGYYSYGREVVFEKLEELGDEVYIEKIVRELAEKNPNVTIQYFNKYKEKPYAKEVLMAVAQRSPGNIFFWVYSYGNEPYAEEVLMIAAGKDPLKALQYAENYGNRPYAHKVIEKTLETLGSEAAEDPFLVIENGYKYFTDPKAKEFFERSVRAAVDRDPKRAIAFIDVYKNQPYAEEIVRKIAEKDPQAVMEYVGKYIEQPFAEVLIRELAEKKPVLVLQYFDSYKSQPYAQEVLEKTARSLLVLDTYSSSHLFYYFSCFADQPYAEEIIRRVAENNPVAAVEHAHKYKDQPYANEVLEKAVRMVTEQSPWMVIYYVDQLKAESYAEEVLTKVANSSPVNALEYAGKYVDQPYAQKIIREAAYALVAGDEAYRVFQNVRAFIDQPYAEEVIRKAAEKFPYPAFQKVANFKNEPYAEGLVRELADKLPSIAVEYFERYKDRPYAKEIFDKAAKKLQDDCRIFELSDRFKTETYAAEVLETTAKKYPRYALESAEKYKDQPYAEEIIRKAAEENPGVALEYAEKYKDQPYAEEIIRKAAEKDPSAAMKYADLSFAEELVEQAARALVEERPDKVFEYHKKLETKAYWIEILEKAARNAVKNGHYASQLLNNFGLIKNQTFAEEVLILASGTVSEEILQKADLYLDQPYAKRVIQAIAEKHQDNVLKYAAKYKNQPYAEEVIKKAAETDPESALKYSKAFSDSPYAGEVMAKAAESHMALALRYSDEYAKQPYAEDIIRKAGEKHPNMALAYANNYADQPYAEDIIRKAGEKNPLKLLHIYSEERHDREPQLTEILKTVVEEKKGVLLGVLNGLRDQLLRGEPVDAGDAQLIELISNGGIEHYRILETSVDYLNMLLKIPEEFRKEFFEINLALLGKFTRKGKKGESINYSNADYVSFYEKCLALKPLTEAKMGILRSFNALTINKENFRTMQEEIFGTFNLLNSLSVSQELLDQLNSEMEKMEKALRENPDVEAQKIVLAEFKNEMRKIMAIAFEKSFGLVNLPELTAEVMNGITPHLNYFTNIYAQTDKNKHIIAFFMLLKITDKWDAFKRGEAVDLDANMNDEMKVAIHEYMKNRETLDVLNVAKAANPAMFEGGKEHSWMKALEAKSEAILIGQSGGVTDLLTQVESNYRDLNDPDNFSDREKLLMDVVRKFGSKEVGGALARRFKDPSYTDEVVEELQLAKLENEKEVLPVLQKVARILGSLIKFTEAVEKADLKKDIDELEAILTPGEGVIKVFAKIGEEMSTKSGAIPVTEDIEYLESILHKKQNELEPEELKLAQDYLENVKAKVLGLYKKVDILAKKFAALHESGSKTREISETLKSRLEAFSRLFVLDQSDRKVTYNSTMTGDLADVIPHIRQCLGCTSRECNNDTNLTFGDRNRFSIITREAGMAEGKSLSDELVTLQKTVNSETGEVSFSFVMDNVYGLRNRDILVTNVLAVLKKVKQLQRIVPGVRVNVFVTGAALSSCSVEQVYLNEKLKAEGGKFEMKNIEKEVHIAQSASGDGHYEIGGGFSGRVSSGVGKVNGIEISLIN